MTSSYHLQSDGQNKYQYRTIKQLFHTFLAVYKLPQHFWSSLFPFVELIINCTLSYSTHYYLAYLVYYKKPRIPSNFILASKTSPVAISSAISAKDTIL